MKTTLILLLSVFIGAAVYSQKNYLPAILLKDGVELSGYIDYRNWSVNPKKISFKKDSLSVEEVFGPNDITSFRVKDEYYVASKVFVENSPYKLASLSTGKEFIYSVDTVFLQAIIDGEKSLFYYKTLKGKDNFYIFQDNEYKLLLYKEYLADSEFDKIGVFENAAFRNQLMMYLIDAKGLDLSAVDYNWGSLCRLFKRYYRIVDSAPLYLKTEDKPKGNWGLVAGITRNKAVFWDDYFESPNLSNDFSTSMVPYIGVSYEIVFPRSLKRWSLCNELAYWGYDFSGSTQIVKNVVQTDTKTKYACHFLKLSNLFRFTYRTPSFDFFVNAGLSQSILIKEEKNSMLMKVKVLETKYSIGHTSVIESKADKHTDVYNQGLVYGAGVGYRDFSLEMRMENNYRLLTRKLSLQTVNSVCLLLSYSF